MKRCVIWGAGCTTKDFLDKKSFYADFDLVGIVDSDKKKQGGTLGGYIIYSPNDIKKIQFDLIIICSLYVDSILDQILEMNLIGKTIITCFDIERQIKDNLFKKYIGNNDSEIQSYIDYYKNHPISVFGPRAGEPDYSEVYRDENDDPYIFYYGKRRDYNFYNINGQEFVCDVHREQHSKSPHLYVRDMSDIKDSSVIVDAGVCEGNFALKYIDKAKKCYLIEADYRWVQALEKTFKPYSKKIVISNKYLARYDSANSIKLDSLVKENIDFLKIDIEGGEVDAIIGGKNVLKKSDARCSICSYHRKEDLENITWLMKNLGYKVEYSEGYMLFIFGGESIDATDLRRGMVYASKDI